MYSIIAFLPRNVNGTARFFAFPDGRLSKCRFTRILCLKIRFPEKYVSLSFSVDFFPEMRYNINIIKSGKVCEPYESLYA